MSCLILVPAAMAQRTEGVPGNAIPIRLPYTSYGASISASQEIDSYQFSAKSGQNITIWLSISALGSELSAVLSFYDGAGKLLAYNDREWNVDAGRYGSDPILYLRIPHDGVYYVSVMAADTFRHKYPPQGGTTGAYDLVLFTTFGGIADKYEPNDSRWNATPVTLPFQSIGVNLLYLGDMDWYAFDARRGDRFSIDIDSLELQAEHPGTYLGVRTRIGIFDLNGNLLQATDSGQDPDDGFSGDPALQFKAPFNGRYYVAVTAQDDSGFVTLFNDPAFLKNPYVSGFENRIGYYTLDIHAINRFYFTQVANGAFGGTEFVTSLLLVNSSAGSAAGSVSFIKSDGTPLVLSLEDGKGASDTHWFSIPARGGIMLKTDGAGEGVSGYAVVSAPASVAGSAVFSQYDSKGRLTTEAGVVPSSPMEFFVLPVELTNSLNAGLAMANAEGNATASLFLKLLKDTGETVATRILSLEPGKQVSVYVAGPDQLFPEATNLHGSLQVFSDTPISVVALRSTPETLTTLIPMEMNQSLGPVNLFFPQIVAGSSAVSYRTKVILTNPGYFTITGIIRFTRSDGDPMNLTIGTKSASSHEFTIPPQGTVFLETGSDSGIQTGYATLAANHGVGAAIVYSQYDAAGGKLVTEVTIPPSPAYRNFIVFAQNDGPFNTGIAVANPNPDGSALQYFLRASADPAAPQKTDALLPGNHQQAVLIAGEGQLFPAFRGNGTLEVNSGQPTPAVALRITATTMTALPIIPIP